MYQLTCLLLLAASVAHAADAATYRATAPLRSGIDTFTLATGPEENGARWLSLQTSRYRLWLLRGDTQVLRYIFQFQNVTREYRHALTGAAVLPSIVDWNLLLPQPAGLPERLAYLGHPYTRQSLNSPAWTPPPDDLRLVPLRPDLWIGPPSNTRPIDDTRRYDGSDYKLRPLTRDDYAEMAAAGITVVKAIGGQQPWAEALGLYFWGPHTNLPYPELLYHAQYLGPALFLDEPAVGTRDHDLRPRLDKEPAFRAALTPQIAFQTYQSHYAKSIRAGAAQVLAKTLAARSDVDLGSLSLTQTNVYNWETMLSTAAYALSQDQHVPSAMVFEPPGRIGTTRTLPEFNMTYGTQFALNDTRVLPALIAAFLRPAARLNNKDWGLSIYGAVQRADTFLWLTQAYDLGATRFFFWDNYQLACVPHHEILALARHLRAHAAQNPHRDLQALRQAASRLILIPPGYDLGHVHMGRGNLWGIPELNLERRNSHNVTYRHVMSRLFAEIERSLQQGIPFDIAWDLPTLHTASYSHIIRIHENGAVDHSSGPPQHLTGPAPELRLSIHNRTATAHLRQTAAPIYYTHGASSDGTYRNAMVLFELYGPKPEDYVQLQPPNMTPTIRELSPTQFEVDIQLPPLAPGQYRLRAATSDTSGRSTITFLPITIAP